jgi:hypothetical protein
VIRIKHPEPRIDRRGCMAARRASSVPATLGDMAIPMRAVTVAAVSSAELKPGRNSCPRCGKAPSRQRRRPRIKAGIDCPSYAHHERMAGRQLFWAHQSSCQPRLTAAPDPFRTLRRGRLSCSHAPELVKYWKSHHIGLSASFPASVTAPQRKMAQLSGLPELMAQS